MRPKIIASTATVRKAEEQVKHVFLRRVAVFPPHGLDIEDNFFSVQRPVEEKPGRLYLGICSPGSSRPAVLIRLYVALLTGAQIALRPVRSGGRPLHDARWLFQFAARTRRHEATGGGRRADSCLPRADESSAPSWLESAERTDRGRADRPRFQQGDSQRNSITSKRSSKQPGRRERRAPST